VHPYSCSTNTASDYIDLTYDDDQYTHVSAYSSPTMHAPYNQAQETSPERKCTLKASPTTAFTPIKKPKKSVLFKPTVTVRTLHSCRYSKDEKSKLYYSKKELETFHLEARAICILSQILPEKTNSGAILKPSRRSIFGLERNDNETALSEVPDSLRGLETMMYPKRNKNKYIAQKSLLKYQTKLNSRPNMTSEQKHRTLAAASVKLNSWSSAVAVETGRLDALRAYADDYMIPISAHHAVSAATTSTAISYCKKRCLQRSTSNRITPENSPRSKKRKFAFGHR